MCKRDLEDLHANTQAHDFMSRDTRLYFGFSETFERCYHTNFDRPSTLRC